MLTRPQEWCSSSRKEAPPKKAPPKENKGSDSWGTGRALAGCQHPSRNTRTHTHTHTHPHHSYVRSNGRINTILWGQRSRLCVTPIGLFSKRFKVLGGVGGVGGDGAGGGEG